MILKSVPKSIRDAKIGKKLPVRWVLRLLRINRRYKQPGISKVL